MNIEAAGHPMQSGGAVGKLEASTATTVLDATVTAAGRPQSAARHGRRKPPPPTAARATRHAVATSWRLKYKDFVPTEMGRPRETRNAVSVSDSCQHQFQ